MTSPLSTKEGWLKAGVVGINKVYPSMKKEIYFLPTTSPYGYSSFLKEENLIEPTF